MFDKIKMDLLNFGLKFISVDEKIVRMFLETKPANINEIVILPAGKIVMKKLVNKLQNKKVHGRVYNGLLNGVKVSIIRSLVGCPNCAIAVECLKRTNAQIILRVDFCGGIEKENYQMKVGDVLIPKIAYCGDGTSPHYIKNNSKLLDQLSYVASPISKTHELKSGNQNVYIAKPNEELKKILLSEGNSNIVKVKEGDFWTTDALFCETNDFITSLKSINVRGIDMENSILFLLGELYNLKTASILSVSDLPGNEKYDMFNSNSIHPDLEKGINIAINTLIKALNKIKSILI